MGRILKIEKEEVMNWSLRRLLHAPMARISLALAALGMALAACGGPGAATADKIKVGAVIPLTGRYAAGGEQIRNGYQLAVDAINDAGGVTVNGTKIPIELTIL